MRAMWLLMSVLMLVFLTGCPEQREKQAREEGQAVFQTVLSKASLDMSNMAAHGRIVNPKYEYTWFGGGGIYSAGSVQAIGVDIGAEVSGSGKGEDPVDQDLREKVFKCFAIFDISNDPDVINYLIENYLHYSTS